jgi:DNA-directed RNA polymerase
MLKQLGILDAVPVRRTRRTKNTAPDSKPAAVTATVTAEEKGAAENDCNEKDEEAVLERAAPPTVSVVSKEQAVRLLKPGPHELVAGTRKRSGSKSNDATATATTTTTTTTTPTHDQAGNGNLKSVVVPPEAEAESEDSSLEGKFVDLVDLLLPVPIKGEFDVNKIKSSLYFFS